MRLVWEEAKSFVGEPYPQGASHHEECYAQCQRGCAFGNVGVVLVGDDDA